MAQLSPGVYNLLPDSLRPVNRMTMTAVELRRIIENAKFLVKLSDSERGELDQLGYKLLSLGRRTDNHREYLNTVGLLIRYWAIQLPAGRGIDSCRKYIYLYKAGIDPKILSDQAHLADYHLYLGSLLMYERSYPRAYGNLLKSISLNKELGDYQWVAYSYGVLAHMFRELSLNENAIQHADSAMHYVNIWKRTKAVNEKLLNMAKGSALVNKAHCYCNLFINTGNRVQADSAISIAQFLEATKFAHVRQEALSLLSRVHYFAGDYKMCVYYAKMMSPKFKNIPSETDKNIYIYQGLSLIQLKQINEGKKILAQSDSIFGSGPEAARAAQELYMYHKRTGDNYNALRYNEKLLALQSLYNSSKHISDVIRVYQNNENIAQNIAIQNLRDQDRKNRYVAALIVAIILLILIIVVIQYRNGIKNTTRLVGQIDELTQLQILHIEEERDKERKRIGRQLHDELSATIAACMRSLYLHADEVSDSGLKSSLILIAEILGSSYDKSRDKSHELYFENSTEQFCDSLHDTIELFFLGSGIEADVTIDWMQLAPTPEIKMTILLCLKEAITNIIKHSRATQVEILTYADQGNLVLSISDNGKGMQTRRHRNGVGLTSIRERVSAVNGTFELSNSGNLGLRLKISIPVGTFEES